MLLDHDAIARLIPHQGAMCLLARVIAHDAQSITCEAESHRDSANPLRNQNGLPARRHRIRRASDRASRRAAQTGRAPAERGFLAVLSDRALARERLDDAPARCACAPLLADTGGGLQYALRSAPPSARGRRASHRARGGARSLAREREAAQQRRDQTRLRSDAALFVNRFEVRAHGIDLHPELARDLLDRAPMREFAHHADVLRRQSVMPRNRRKLRDVGPRRLPEHDADQLARRDRLNRSKAQRSRFSARTRNPARAVACIERCAPLRLRGRRGANNNAIAQHKAAPGRQQTARRGVCCKHFAARTNKASRLRGLLKPSAQRGRRPVSHHGRHHPRASIA